MRHLEVKVLPLNEPLKNTAMCHEIIKADTVALFAMNLITVMLSNRRAISDYPPSDGLVSYACDVAEKAFKEFTVREWVVDVPSLTELKGEVKFPPGFGR